MGVSPATAGAPTPSDPALYFFTKSGSGGSNNISATIKTGKTKTFSVIAANNGPDADTFELGGSLPPAEEFKVTWYEGLKATPKKKINIDRVPGFVYTANPGSAKSFTVTIKRKQGSETCVGANLSSTTNTAEVFGVVAVNTNICLL